MRTSGVPVGVSLTGGADGDAVQIQTVGVDETADLGAIQHTASMVLGEARQAGVSIPGPLMLTEARAIPFMLTEAQVFYSGGRPVEARVAGHRAEIDHWTEDNQPVLLFPRWSSEPAPRWAEDGGLLPEDAARAHWAVRASSAMLDGELKPTLRRLWNLSEHANAAFLPWRGLRDLAEAEAEQPEDLQRVTRLVLNLLKENAEGAAEFALTDAGAPWRDRLVRELKKRLRELRRAAGMSGDAPPAVDAGANVTEAAAEWLAGTFQIEGAKSAEELRRRAEVSPWAPWAPEDAQDFAFLLRRLVTLTWRNGLEAEAERARRNRPALPRVTAVDVSDVATRNAFLPGLDDGLVRSSKGGVRATISGGVVDVERVREGLALMPSMPFHRMVRTLVHAGYDQAEAGVEDYRVVSVPGGYAGLTERLELSAKYRKDVRLIAEAGARIEWRIGGRQGIAWWTLDAPVPGVTFAHRGQGAEVTFTLGTMLLPYAARRMRQQQTLADDAIDRRLVPELRHDPPMYGRGNEQAAIYTMARRFLTFMVDNGLALARDGGIVVTPDQWAQLAKDSGLPAVLALKVVRKWADGDGDTAPPLIEYLDGGLVRLSETYRAEHDFIVDGVRRRAKRDQDIKRAHQRRKQES